MTRDEAKTTVCEHLKWDHPYAERFVAALEALGLMEFDPPLTAEKRFEKVIHGIPFADRTIRGLTEALAAAGLEVVEKRR